MSVDLRRLRVGIQIGDKINYYEGLRIYAKGKKFANPLQNECEITLSGLRQEVRDHLLTDTSPYNKNKVARKLILEVGRDSIGLFTIFVGDIVSAEPSSPPDVDVHIKAKTMSSQTLNIVASSTGPMEKLSVIARLVANDLAIPLNFQATDKNIANYSFTGPALRQVRKLQDMGGVRAFIDDDVLIVKDYDKTVKDRKLVLNKKSGMVGIPKATENGVEVSYLITGQSALGGKLELQSEINKSLNGDYNINQLEFEVSSHDDPFFYKALCTRL